DTRMHRQVRTVPVINADYAYVPSTGDLFAAAPGSTPAYMLLDPHTGHASGTFILSKLWQTTRSTPFEPAIVTSDGRHAFLVWAATGGCVCKRRDQPVRARARLRSPRRPSALLRRRHGNGDRRHRGTLGGCGTHGFLPRLPHRC